MPDQAHLSMLLWLVAADPKQVAAQSPTPITPGEVERAQYEARLILTQPRRRAAA